MKNKDFSKYVKFKCKECGENVEILNDYYVNIKIEKCLSCYHMNDTEWGRSSFDSGTEFYD